MSHNSTEKKSIKERIVAHLPGHKNQDANHNGVPDRLESTRSGNDGLIHGTDRNHNGVPDALERNHATTVTTAQPIVANTGVVNNADLNRNGIPDVLERNSSYTVPVTPQNTSVDLNRNGIPDRYEQNPTLTSSGSFGFIGSTVATTTSQIDVRELPTETTRVEKPAIVHEVIKTEETIQIQPVIERERDQTDIYEVVQPIREHEVMPTVVSEVTLAPVIVSGTQASSSNYVATDTTMAPEVRSTMQKAPIVQEKVVHRIVEEIHPVIYKEVPAHMAHQFTGSRAVGEVDIERTTTTTVGAARIIGEEIRIGQLAGNLQGVNLSQVEAYVQEQIRTGNFTETTTVTKSIEHATMSTQQVGSQTTFTTVNSAPY